MAKAREIPGLDGSMPYGDAAVLTVATRARELDEHSAGVLDMRDIERVHAMRVATRRLRAVLEIYAPCFAEHELKPVLRDVKALADALGERRDPDVELLALEQFAASVGPDERAGVEVFIERTRAQQLAANAALAQALEAAERSDLRARLERLTEPPPRLLPEPAPGASQPQLARIAGPQPAVVPEPPAEVARGPWPAGTDEDTGP